jgi:hypothetical protein
MEHHSSPHEKKDGNYLNRWYFTFTTILFLI